MLSGPTTEAKYLECKVFFSSFGASYLPLEVYAVTTSLCVAEVIKTCGSHARQIVSPAVDTLLDKCRKRATVWLDHKGGASNLQDLEVC